MLIKQGYMNYYVLMDIGCHSPYPTNLPLVLTTLKNGVGWLYITNTMIDVAYVSARLSMSSQRPEIHSTTHFIPLLLFTPQNEWDCQQFRHYQR